MEPLEQRRLFSIAALDPAFGDEGAVRIDVGGHEQPAQILTLANGKSLVVGLVDTKDRHGFVARLKADGTLDPSFGDGGFVILDPIKEARRVAVTANGRILVAGNQWYGAQSSNFTLVRLRANGALDTTFGTDGVVSADFNGSADFVHKLLVDDATGRIVVIGEARYPYTPHGDDADVGIMVCTADGQLDTTFATDGTVALDFGSNERYGDRDVLGDAALQEDGKLVVSLTAYTFAPEHTRTGVYVVRLDTAGSFDSTFSDDVADQSAGDDGIKPIYLTDGVDWSTPMVGGLAILPDGQIVLSCSTIWDDHHFLLQLNADGSVDQAFGSNGTVTIHGGDFTASILLVDDHLLTLDVDQGHYNVVTIDGTRVGYANYRITKPSPDEASLAILSVHPTPQATNAMVLGVWRPLSNGNTQQWIGRLAMSLDNLEPVDPLASIGLQVTHLPNPAPLPDPLIVIDEEEQVPEDEADEDPVDGATDTVDEPDQDDDDDELAPQSLHTATAFGLAGLFSDDRAVDEDESLIPELTA